MTIDKDTIAELRALAETAKKTTYNTCIYYGERMDIILQKLPSLLDALEAERARPLNLITIDCPCGTRHVFSKKDAEEEYTYSRTQAEGKRDEHDG